MSVVEVSFAPSAELDPTGTHWSPPRQKGGHNLQVVRKTEKRRTSSLTPVADYELVCDVFAGRAYRVNATLLFETDDGDTGVGFGLQGAWGRKFTRIEIPANETQSFPIDMPNVPNDQLSQKVIQSGETYGNGETFTSQERTLGKQGLATLSGDFSAAEDGVVCIVFNSSGPGVVTLLPGSSLIVSTPERDADDG